MESGDQLGKKNRRSGFQENQKERKTGVLFRGEGLKLIYLLMIVHLDLYGLGV